MDIQPRRRVKPPRTRANRPEVISHRTRIVAYHEAGKGMREISLLLGISRDTVRLWVRRYREEGHVLTRPRPGGPRVTTPEEEELIRREAERAPLSKAVSITNTAGLQCHPIK
ncbi:hypothetical protein Pcinc_008191 [Petrolisthes cinctipes]|uniref:Insertion element IS150 protein InsJ-like helix-turn-helix domain-containing protein n=1 Tax=Petrolisthes cinctipes TaxID=88211 RepID=A0AAE1KW46_PETCI|nr:hypothetical protein Pcinc_008191 [Petrolisthes cinctipes]